MLDDFAEKHHVEVLILEREWDQFDVHVVEGEPLLLTNLLWHRPVPVIDTAHLRTKAACGQSEMPPSHTGIEHPECPAFSIRFFTSHPLLNNIKAFQVTVLMLRQPIRGQTAQSLEV
jgi:hypothetical protein